MDGTQKTCDSRGNAVNIDILLSLTSKFLTLREMGRLDTALSCKGHRQYFMSTILPTYISHLKKDTDKRDSNRYVMWIGKRCLPVRHLNLRSDITDEALQLISGYCMNLETLSITFNTDLDVDIFLSILKRANNLRKFCIMHNLAGSYIHFGQSKRKILTSIMCCLADNCPKLDSFSLKTDFGRFFFLRDCCFSGLEKIVEQCPELQHLDLRGCKYISIKVINQLADLFTRLRSSNSNESAATPTIQGNQYHGLNYLNLHNCREIRPESLTNLCRSCPTLKELHLGLKGINKQSLRQLGTSCKMLETLSIVADDKSDNTYESENSSFVIDDSSMYNIFNNCINLKTFDIPGINCSFNSLDHIHRLSNLENLSLELRSLGNLRSTLPSVQTLDVSTYGDNDTDDELVVDAVQKCPNLRELSFIGSDMSLFGLSFIGKQLETITLNYQSNITDVGITALVSGCTKLTSISLYGSEKLTDVALNSIAASLPSLESLDIPSNSWITDVGITRLSETCHNLRHLDICGCDVTDVGIASLSSHCKQLKSLNISGNVSVTDVGIISLSTHCRYLTDLDISYLPVSDDGVNHLLAHCRQLKKLALTEGMSVPTATIIHIMTTLDIKVHLTRIE